MRYLWVDAIGSATDEFESYLDRLELVAEIGVLDTSYVVKHVDYPKDCSHNQDKVGIVAWYSHWDVIVELLKLQLPFDDYTSIQHRCLQYYSCWYYHHGNCIHFHRQLIQRLTQCGSRTQMELSMMRWDYGLVKM